MIEENYTREPKEFTDKLWSLKNGNKLCDAAVVINEQRIPVHAVVLASSSKFFELAFEKNVSPKEVIFEDVDLGVINSLIQYCYTGSINITENNALELYKLANALSIPKIIENSSKVVKKIMNVDNCLSIWKIFLEVNSKDSSDVIFEFIKKNFKEVVRTSEFSNLEFSDVKKLLNCELKIEPEETVYHAVKTWINYDSMRINHFPDLLDLIKMECLPLTLLSSEFESMNKISSRSFSKFVNAIELKNQNNSIQCTSSSKTTLIIVGDNEMPKTKKMEIFDQSCQKWIEVKFDECNRFRFAPILLDTKLLLFGGFLNRKVTNTVESYDLQTGQMENLPAMKIERTELSVVKYENSIYAIGGGNVSVQTVVEKYDLTSKTWETVAPMKIHRASAGTVVFGAEIFVIGGFGGMSFREYLSSVEAYNPTTNTWRMCKSMSERRYKPAASVVGDYIYVAGGNSGNQAVYTNTVEKYDPKSDTWTMVQSLEIARYGMGSACYNGKLVVAGGLGRGAYYTVEAYDEKTDKWSPMPSLTDFRHHTNLIEIPWVLAEKVLERNASK